MPFSGLKPGGGVYLIAEAGPNFRMGSRERDLEMCAVMIRLAARAGVDAVKFQAYTADYYYAEGPADYGLLGRQGLTLKDAARELALEHDMIPVIAEMCSRAGVDFLCSVFSETDFLAVDPHVGAHKIASNEINHLRLLELAGRGGKPVILSTGASTHEEIAWALEVLDRNQSGPVCLLQCTAAYPAPPESLNLRAMAELGRTYGRAHGFSDHSEDPYAAPLGAAALGAQVIEKHYTLDRRLPGPDHSFAIEPGELGELVRRLRLLEKALGSPEKFVAEPEKACRALARRAVHTLKPVKKGEVFVEGDNIAILRPGGREPGAHPRFIEVIAGRKAARDLDAGQGVLPEHWEA